MSSIVVGLEGSVSNINSLVAFTTLDFADRDGSKVKILVPSELIDGEALVSVLVNANVYIEGQPSRHADGKEGIIVSFITNNADLGLSEAEKSLMDQFDSLLVGEPAVVQIADSAKRKKKNKNKRSKKADVTNTSMEGQVDSDDAENDSS